MKKIAATVSLVLLNAATAFAEGAEHGGHAGSEGPASLIWPFVNFFIFFGILFYLLKNPFLQAWETRRALIEDGVTRGARELNAAEEFLATAKSQLAAVDTSSRKLVDSIVQDTHAESVQLVDEAKRRAEFIARQAVDNLNAEQRHAEVSLRREIAQHAIEKATALLKSEITPDIDRELRKGVVSGVRQLAQ